MTATFNFCTAEYRRSHMKEPKGRGSWAFRVEGHEFFAPGSSTLTEAKAYAKAKAAELAAGATGRFTIHILP